MQCRDAQFYLRLRRHAGDELGADVSADLDRHLAECPACAVDARSAESFDRAVAVAMRAVPVPGGLRDRLLAQGSAHRGAVIRRKAYRVAALAASLFLTVGFAFGMFSANRQNLDTNQMVMDADGSFMAPDHALRRWLVAQKLPDTLPKSFDTSRLVFLGTERLQGKDVPVAVFAADRSFAKVYILRSEFDTRDLQNAQASHTVVEVDATRPGVKYVTLYTPGLDGSNPFLLAMPVIKG